MYCGTVSLMDVAPSVGTWMRINAERLARAKKDSEVPRSLHVRPIWLAVWPRIDERAGWWTSLRRLYQRTVVIFWKPLIRNPCLEIARALQFRKRSPPALGN